MRAAYIIYIYVYTQSEEILFPTKSLAIRVTLVWAYSARTTLYTRPIHTRICDRRAT